MKKMTVNQIVRDALSIVPPEDLGRVKTKVIAEIRRSRFKVLKNPAIDKDSTRPSCDLKIRGLGKVTFIDKCNPTPHSSLPINSLPFQESPMRGSP